METVKKINLLDATNDKVYHDKFGWVNSKITVNIKGKIVDRYSNSSQEYNGSASGCYFGDESNGHITFKSYSEIFGQLSNRILLDYEYKFDKIYNNNPYAGYGYREGREISDPQITFSWIGVEVTKFTQIEVYEGVCNDRLLFDYQISEGLRVQCRLGESSINKGTFLVTKLFEQPNRENNLCVIERLIKDETAEAKPITIKCNQKVLYSVPYETYEETPDETSIFNQPLNEDLLAPFIEKTANESKDANLYWLSIEDASAYTVSLYKKRNAEQQKYKIYLLECFEVDRNRHWITLHNLIGNGYIVLLEAESREGSVIARTRGINVDTKNLEWF